MIYRDRVYYRDDGSAAAIERPVSKLKNSTPRIGEMCRAYGHSVLHEMGCEAYLHDKLHRSTTERR